MALFSVIDLEAVINDNVLFEGLSFSLNPGSILQVEGSNGSGKTTLLRQLIGMSVPDHGDIQWDGQSIYQDKLRYYDQMVYMGHKNAIKADLSLIENLNYAFINVRNDKKSDTVLESLGLLELRDNLAKSLSAGQKRRLAMARLLLSEAILWILDEPFTSIDVNGIAILHQCFIEHINNGGMIILTSHHAIDMGNINISRVKLNYTSHAV